ALTQAMADAVAAAHTDRYAHDRLPWPPSDLDDFLSTLAVEREGWRQWNAPQQLPASTVRTFLHVVWWTDFLGRKHFRILADRNTLAEDRDRNIITKRHPPFPPLEIVYPHTTFQQEQPGGRRLCVRCACGVEGEPATLGWMGPCCGPCHDRREFGGETGLLVG